MHREGYGFCKAGQSKYPVKFPLRQQGSGLPSSPVWRGRVVLFPPSEARLPTKGRGAAQCLLRGDERLRAARPIVCSGRGTARRHGELRPRGTGPQPWQSGGQTAPPPALGVLIRSEFTRLGRPRVVPQRRGCAVARLLYCVCRNTVVVLKEGLIGQCVAGVSGSAVRDVWVFGAEQGHTSARVSVKCQKYRRKFLRQCGDCCSGKRCWKRASRLPPPSTKGRSRSTCHLQHVWQAPVVVPLQKRGRKIVLKKAAAVRFCCVVTASRVIAMLQFSTLVLKSLISTRGVWDRLSPHLPQYGFIKFYRVGPSLPEMTSLYVHVGHQHRSRRTAIAHLAVCTGQQT